MTGYLALAALLLLSTVLVLALQPGHRRVRDTAAVAEPDRDRLQHELSAIRARVGDSGPSRMTGLLAAAAQSTPWHRAPLRVDEVDLAR